MYKSTMVYFPLLLLSLLLLSCDTEAPTTPMLTSIPTEDWDKRQVNISPVDSFEAGKTYLSSYSEIYVQSQHRKMGLTGTISMRNVNMTDTIYLETANYYNTNGSKNRSYFDAPIYLAPLETIEIIITQDDIEAGSGDNFVFSWQKPPGSQDPFFEGVFITVYGQQGISFTTRGIRIE